MSKICARTGINRLWRVVRQAHQPPPAWVLVCLLTPFLLSCASVRPVVKIGLIAPFEGLYRHTGYAALNAMRAAIQEAASSPVDLLPLALDDSNDSQHAYRTAQKLLRDPQVRALVGPLTPATVSGIGEPLAHRPVLWFAPSALTKAGFTSPPTQQAALVELIREVAPVIRQQGAQRLALAGWANMGSWPLDDSLALPGLLITQVAEVQAQDAVFWLGNAADGAAFLTELRQVQPHVPFWLGLQAEDPVFTARTPVRSQVYWAAWADSGYDQWRQTHPPAPLLAYQVYVATQQAIAQLTAPSPPAQGVWSLRFFTLMSDGSSQPLAQE